MFARVNPPVIKLYLANFLGDMLRGGMDQSFVSDIDHVGQKLVKGAVVGDIASRRSAPRIRSFKEAKVILHDWGVINCLMRNTSDAGARLEFSAVIDLPDKFGLLIVSTDSLIQAARVWQRGLSAGVKFTGGGKLATS